MEIKFSKSRNHFRDSIISKFFSRSREEISSLTSINFIFKTYAKLGKCAFVCDWDKSKILISKDKWILRSDSESAQNFD